MRRSRRGVAQSAQSSRSVTVAAASRVRIAVEQRRRSPAPARGVVLRAAQQVERDALGRLAPMPGSLGSSWISRRRVPGSPTRQCRGSSGRRSAPPHLRLDRSSTLRAASLTAASDQVLQHLDVVGVDDLGVDLEAASARFCAVHLDLDHAAAGSGLDQTPRSRPASAPAPAAAASSACADRRTDSRVSLREASPRARRPTLPPNRSSASARPAPLRLLAQLLLASTDARARPRAERLGRRGRLAGRDLDLQRCRPAALRRERCELVVACSRDSVAKSARHARARASRPSKRALAARSGCARAMGRACGELEHRREQRPRPARAGGGGGRRAAPGAARTAQLGRPGGASARRRAPDARAARRRARGAGGTRAGPPQRLAPSSRRSTRARARRTARACDLHELQQRRARAPRAGRRRSRTRLGLGEQVEPRSRSACRERLRERASRSRSSGSDAPTSSAAAAGASFTSRISRRCSSSSRSEVPVVRAVVGEASTSSSTAEAVAGHDRARGAVEQLAIDDAEQRRHVLVRHLVAAEGDHLVEQRQRVAHAAARRARR